MFLESSGDDGDMKNIENIFSQIDAVDHRTVKNPLKHKIRISGELFCSTSIFILLEHAKYIMQNNLRNFELKIVINTKYIADEATLIVFEILLYYLIKNSICDITYTFIVDKTLLGYENFRTSNLFQYNTRKINNNNFVKTFEKETQICRNHFRKLCVNNEENKAGIFLSILLSDITTFLSAYNIEKEYAEDLSEVITEIVGNSLEHSDGDCLLDIKIVVDNVHKYKNINVTTITISDILIGSNIKQYIGDTNRSSYSPRNEIVLTAYDNHRSQFSENYDINTFSTISAFQKYVTTRKNSIGSGGTGLTTLIKQLKNKAREDYCYVLSGDDVIYFKEPFLDLTEEGLIGFNNDNDYLSKIPSPEIVSKNLNRFNGTIYNLSFILDERNEENE